MSESAMLKEPVGPDPGAVHAVDEVLPPRRLITLGLQHLFIMYSGAVAVPLIVGPALHLSNRNIALLVSADLLVAGVCTLIQAIGIGNSTSARRSSRPRRSSRCAS